MIPLPAPDKLAHALAGALIFNAAALLAQLLGLDMPAAVAMAAVSLAAVGKELSDRWHNHHARAAGRPEPHGVELLDAAATLAGGALCALPLLVLR